MKRRVPEVLWKLFQNRARTLAETLHSLIPSATAHWCHCRGSQHCLGCHSDGDRMSFLLREDDPSDYRNLLNHCFVVLSDIQPSPPLPYDYNSRYPQIQIVTRTIEMILSENTSSKNVICSGYNKRTRSSIVLEALTSPSWSLLLKRIGDALMVYLLKYSSIFIPINKRKHNQVAGAAIIDLCWKHSKNQQHSLGGVIDKAGSVTMNTDITKSCQAIDVDLSQNNGVLSRKRSRSHACRRKRKRRKLSSGDTTTTCCLSQEKMCRCWQKLCKIPTENQINKLPMLYNLERTSSILPRKHIINSLRPNVCGANALLKDIFECSHTNAIRTTCQYHALHKPLRVVIRKAIHCPRVKILYKHVLVAASTSTVSQSQVESFVWAACMNIIPRQLLGNWRILRKNISKFIRLRLYEKFSLHQCMHKLKLSEFPLLCNSRYHLERWIYWLFASVIVPLLQANFYVTESEHGKLQLFFYEKSVWKKLTKGCLNDDSYSLMNVTSVEQIVNSRRFGFSRVRFRPKAIGILRPLANLKASSRLAGKKFKAVNAVLQDLHVALKDVQIKNPEKLGSSVFSYNEVHKNLRNLLSRIKNGRGKLPCVYMVIADVQKAYDSISQDKLLHLMKDVLVDEDHLLHHTHQVIASHRHLQVVPYVNSCKQFRSGAQIRSHGIIIVDQGTLRTATKRDLCFNLQQHVKKNLLYTDKQFYLQKVGIPQGSILSSLLCSFYYGHMENCKIIPFLEKVIKSQGLDESADFMLLRFIDDFLFISTSKKLALGFLSRLERGFCEYNCNMNKDKFGLSFDYDRMKSNRSYVDEDGNKFLPWSGLFINCKTLEVQADYTRYLDGHLRATLTLCWQGNPSQHFRKKICDYLRPKCHAIFYDSNINSASVVRLNIHQAFLLCAMKFHCYACHMSDICCFDSGSYFDIICNSVRYMYRLMKRRVYCVHLQGVRPILKVKRREVEWLGLTAYIQVLKRKQSRYKDLLYMLESELELELELKSPDLKFAVDKSNSSILWKIKY